MAPRFDLVVGCNGAGKSSLIEDSLIPMLPRSAFVNADVIAKARWGAAAEQNAYEAAKIAAETRDVLIQAKRPFIAETVFSHPSKLDLIDQAHSQGFTVVLHVVMIPEDLAVRRVASRVAAGGHTVPEEKIRERYNRLWPLVADAVARCERTFIYDNSGFEMRHVAQFDTGSSTGSPRWPRWTPSALTGLA